jgi:HEAT repeat protein
MSVLQVLGLVIGVELVLITLLLVTTLITQASKSGRTTQRLRELWNTLLPAALLGDTAAVSRIRESLSSKAKWKALHSFVDEQLRQGRGQSLLGLRRVCHQVGLTERLHRELLQARNPLDRAAAGKTLGRLHEKIAEKPVFDLLSSKDPAVVLAAAYATASFRDPEQFLPVFRAIYGRTPITLHGAADLLSAFEERICPVVHRLLDGVARQYGQVEGVDTAGRADLKTGVDRSDIAAQVVMTDLLAFYAYRPAASTLLRLLKVCRDEEVLIHLVKAVASIGDPAAVPRLTELLTHPNWVIRSQSAQSLAELRAVEATPSILALLADGNAAVRLCAQETLCSLKNIAAAGRQEAAVALI